MATCLSKSNRQRITPASHRTGLRLALAVRHTTSGGSNRPPDRSAWCSAARITVPVDLFVVQQEVGDLVRQHPYGRLVLVHLVDRFMHHSGRWPVGRAGTGPAARARVALKNVGEVLILGRRQMLRLDQAGGVSGLDQSLAQLGVQRVGVQRKGTPGQARREYERTRSFRRMRNWRVGIEARISHLKRSFGFRRTRLRRLTGARTWAGLGIFAYNLHRMTTISQ